MRVKSFIAFFVVMLFPLSGWAATGDLKSRDWSVKSESLIKNPPSSAEVVAFVDSLRPKGKDSIGKAGGTLCNFAFADMSGKGMYNLVAAIDYSGRQFCSDVEVIGQQGESFKMAALEFPPWDANTLPARLRDVDNDGVADFKAMVGLDALQRRGFLHGEVEKILSLGQRRPGRCQCQVRQSLPGAAG
jgi:hypothetical protein